MARVYKTKDIQTQPHLAGDKNMTAKVVEKAKDIVEDDLMASLIPVMDEGIRQVKRGTNWTGEELLFSVREYFIYCGNHSLKPSKSSIRIWLGCSRSQYHAWQSEPQKYGAVSDVIRLANDMMETQYINRGESHPTMNVFLLKSGHGHSDKTEIQVSSGSDVSTEDISEAISKLGLGEKE